MSLHSRYYVHTNHQGSVIALTSSSGNTVQKYEYDSFGNPYVITASATGSISLVAVSSYTGSLHENSRLYTGREYDKETSLYFLRARYYDAKTGKFISRDPIGQNDQINLYTYVANSPVMYVDLTGEFLDTFWDAANVVLDLGRAVKNVAEVTYGGAKYAYASVTDNACLQKQSLAGIKQDSQELLETAIDAGTDALATMIPFVPAGGTKLARAVENTTPIPPPQVVVQQAKNGKVLRGSANPKVKEAAAIGRQKHKEYDYGEGYEKEYTLPGYGRADAVNEKLYTVKELKPNNPHAIARGEKQLEGYIEGLERKFPKTIGKWKSGIVTY